MCTFQYTLQERKSSHPPDINLHILVQFFQSTSIYQTSIFVRNFDDPISAIFQYFLRGTKGPKVAVFGDKNISLASMLKVIKKLFLHISFFEQNKKCLKGPKVTIIAILIYFLVSRPNVTIENRQKYAWKRKKKFSSMSWGSF